MVLFFNVVIFGVGNSLSARVDNMKKKIVLGEGLTQVDDTAITAETKYSINVTISKNKFFVC